MSKGFPKKLSNTDLAISYDSLITTITGLKISKSSDLDLRYQNILQLHVLDSIIYFRQDCTH